MQIANAGDLERLHHHGLGQEIIGELDPQTGILYTSAPLSQSSAHMATIDTGKISQITHLNSGSTILTSSAGADLSAQTHYVVSTATTAMEHGHKPVDFLTSALSQAQINLDPYQFIEDNNGQEQQQQQRPSVHHIQDSQLHATAHQHQQQQQQEEVLAEVVHTSHMPEGAQEVIQVVHSGTRDSGGGGGQGSAALVSILPPAAATTASTASGVSLGGSAGSSVSLNNSQGSSGSSLVVSQNSSQESSPQGMVMIHNLFSC